MRCIKVSAWDAKDREYTHWFIGSTQNIEDHARELAFCWSNSWGYDPVVIEEYSEEQWEEMSF